MCFNSNALLRIFMEIQGVNDQWKSQEFIPLIEKRTKNSRVEADNEIN